MGVVLRDYQPEDFERVKEIHDASQLDYELPNLSSPLFLVTKVYEVDGIVRACGALYLQLECYLFLDKSDWAGPEDKFDAIKELDIATMAEAWLKGIECCVLWLPPNMGRFGERLVEDLHFTKDRDGWISFSKHLCG